MLKTIVREDEPLEIRVSRTVLGKPVYLNSFFFVDGLLIDTGPRHVSREVAEILHNLPVEKVAITHQHEDHTGNCSLIQERLGVPVFAHPLTLKVMADPPPIQYYRKFMWGSAPPASGRPLPALIHTSRFQFQVIHTPGHSPDHVSFFEPDRKWLFCGDHYLGEKLTGFMQGENIADHLAGLKKLIRLKPRVLFCGLKGWLDNPIERLQNKYLYWWNLGVQVNNLYRDGLSPGRICRKLLGGEVPFYLLSQLNWGRKHLIDSFIEHRSIFQIETAANRP